MMLFEKDIINIVFRYVIALYRHIYLPIRVFMIRRKKIINVAFILSDLGKWKTESLLQWMLNHKRFDPTVLVVPYAELDNRGIPILIEYLNRKGYKYHLLEKKQRITDVVKSDIIFYQEPYKGNLDSNKEYKNNLKSLFCYVTSFFHIIDESWSLNQPLMNFAWQVYFENKITVSHCSEIMTN
jgi:hypothetical protein